MAQSSVVAYFSMEVGLEPEMPTYSGGLGVLAGDTLRAAADLAIPMVGVTLLHRKGYFRQHLDEHGKQSESPADWYPEEFLEPQRPRISVSIHGREVHVRAWRYTVHGITGHSVPVFFLDTALEENSEWDQTLTDYLYGGDEYLRLCQEVILGLGGVSMLRSLGYKKVTAYHMNEGHSALLVLALLEERLHESEEATVSEDDMDAVRQGCVFTTHTPVPAGHDNFPIEMVRQILGEERTNFLISSKCCLPERLNMTYLGLTFSRYINGVSLRHGVISQNMFPDYPIDSVSNGVHGLTWTAPPFRRLYDKYMPEWRDDNLYLRYAISIPLDEIISAHGETKRELFEEIEKRADVTLDPKVMTLGLPGVLPSINELICCSQILNA
jgi:starch phosphorylase